MRTHPFLLTVFATFSLYSVTFLTVLLTMGLFGSAGWRAYQPEMIPPTPTLPPIEANRAYVSALFGEAHHILGAQQEVLTVGSQLEAGTDSHIHTLSPGWLRLALADGTILFLDSETEITLAHLADPNQVEARTQIQLRRGRMLISSRAEGERQAQIYAPEGDYAHLTTAGLLGLEYIPRFQRFAVHCLQGSCLFVNATGTTQPLQAGERATTRAGTDAMPVEQALFGLFTGLGDRGLVPTVTPSPMVPTPTWTLTPLPAAQPADLPAVEMPVNVEPPSVEVVPTPTSTPSALPATPVVESMETPTATATPVPPATPTPQPPTGTPAAQPTAAQTALPTATTTPVAQPTATPVPPTNTPVPPPTVRPTNTTRPQPTATPTVLPVVTHTSVPTNTPVPPTNTPVPVQPMPTPVPPTATSTVPPVATETPTPQPTATPVPAQPTPTPTIAATSSATAQPLPSEVPPTATPTVAAASSATPQPLPSEVPPTATNTPGVLPVVTDTPVPPTDTPIPPAGQALHHERGE